MCIMDIKEMHECFNGFVQFCRDSKLIKIVVTIILIGVAVGICYYLGTRVGIFCSNYVNR